MKTIYTLFFSVLLSFSSFSQNYPEVKIHTGREGLVQLARLGVPAEEGYFDKVTFHTVISREQLRKITAAGFRADVIHDDYPSFVRRRNADSHDQIRRINRAIRNGMAAPGGDHQVPANFNLGSMGGFLTLQEVMAELDSMQTLFPGLITPKAVCVTTQTHEGRQMYYVRITNLAVTQAKPKVMYNSLTHAREPIGMQQMMYYMWYLLENYSTNEEVKYLVDNLDMYFIPVVNPDGYEYNHTTDPGGGGMWRKNRRNNNDGSYGVDLNRNFGYKWGYDDIGSSPISSEPTYRGPSAFSEPETQIIRDFCAANNMVISMNYHSFGNYFLYPWCYTQQYTPDSAINVSYGILSTRENRYQTGLPAEILYTTNGDVNDWLYGDQTTKPKVISFTPEVGTGNDNFWPPVDRILPLCQENLKQNLMIAHLAYRYAEAKDFSKAIYGQKTGYLKYDFTRYGMEAGGTYTVSAEPLNPSLVISTGAPKVYNAPEQLAVIHDSIAFTLAEDIEAGTEFRLLLKCSNGQFTLTDTLRKWYGQEIVVFSDSCHTMGNWFGTPWNVTSFRYHSVGGSITDSPSGPYPNNANSSVTMKEKVDLRDSPVAVITFWTQFELENTFDYVQIKVSDSSENSFIPVGGRYTRNGSANEDKGKPVYDGNQYQWLNEQIVLTSYVNNDIKVRFSLKSDVGTRDDGFYFDDFRISIIDMTLTGTGKPKESAGFTIAPNPADEHAVIRYNGSGRMVLQDMKGVVLKEWELTETQGEIHYPASELPAGIYLWRMTGSNGVSTVKKLVVSH